MTMNANSMPPDLNRQILEEASAWFVDFRVGDVDVECRAEFDRWLRQSPEHIRAYLEIARAYHSLSELSAEQVAKLSELTSLAPGDQNVVRLEPNAPHDPATNPTSRSAASTRGATGKRSSASAIGDVSSRSRPKIGRWISASMAAAAAAGVIAWIALPRYSYSTGIGESRTITMTDGSMITLNALSEIRVRYTKTARLIDLRAGQAFFQVAENKDRPFIVRSGFAVVKDVGTQFDVDRAAKSTTVTVVEGRVALYSADEASSAFSTQEELGPGVSPDGASAVTRTPQSTSRVASGSSVPPDPQASGGSSGILLAAGEQAVVSEHEISTQIHANVSAATSWLKHRFVFDGSHLSDVVDQFNRYNARQIVIDSAALNDVRISGIYSSTDPNSFLRFLRAQPGIEVTQVDGAFHIAKK